MTITPFGLSELQQEVLQLTAAGHSVTYIAHTLWKTGSTIRYHHRMLVKYFGVTTLPEALEKARLWDMVEQP